MRGMDRDTGGALSGDAHVIASIHDILTTPKGSRVMLREYGSDIFKLVDRPQNELFDVEFQAAVAEALDRWEPRFKLTSVWLSSRSADGRIALGLEGQIVADSRVVRLEGITL